MPSNAYPWLANFGSPASRSWNYASSSSSSSSQHAQPSTTSFKVPYTEQIFISIIAHIARSYWQLFVLLFLFFFIINFSANLLQKLLLYSMSTAFQGMCAVGKWACLYLFDAGAYAWAQTEHLRGAIRGKIAKQRRRRSSRNAQDRQKQYKYN